RETGSPRGIYSNIFLRAGSRRRDRTFEAPPDREAVRILVLELLVVAVEMMRRLREYEAVVRSGAPVLEVLDDRGGLGVRSLRPHCEGDVGLAALHLGGGRDRRLAPLDVVFPDVLLLPLHGEDLGKDRADRLALLRRRLLVEGDRHPLGRHGGA